MTSWCGLWQVSSNTHEKNRCREEPSWLALLPRWTGLTAHTETFTSLSLPFSFHQRQCPTSKWTCSWRTTGARSFNAGQRWSPSHLDVRGESGHMVDASTSPVSGLNALARVFQICIYLEVCTGFPLNLFKSKNYVEAFTLIRHSDEVM